MQIDWPSHFDVTRTIKVKTDGVGARVKSLDFVSLTVKDAICDRFRQAQLGRPNVDTRTPDARIQVFLSPDTATIYLDSSGEALFKRGWRRETGDAPLKENLAAGILLGLSPSLGLAATPAATCNDRCLRGLMDQYLSHLVKHDPSGLPIARGAVIRENAHPVALGEGVWKLASQVKAKQVFADPTTKNVWAYFALQLNDAPLAQASVRLKVAGRKITEVETLVNTGPKANGGPYPGGPYNAENILEQDVLYFAPVPPERRSTRDR